MPDLFARPLGPDGEPAGPMRRLGSNVEVRVDPGARDQWEKVEKIVTRPNPYLPGLRPARFLNEYTFTIKPGDEARVMSLFHGGPTWLWETRLAWVRCDTRPVSRGTAWRDGAYAACQHQLTGPPEPPPRPRFPRTAVYPQWFLDLLVLQMQRAYAEHPELFDPRAWTTGDLPTDLATRQLAEQPTRPTIRLYDRNWNVTTVIGEGVYAAPRTVARDYPPPAEPCQECIAFNQACRDRLRALYVALIAARRPRTDFMPHYPNGGHR